MRVWRTARALAEARHDERTSKAEGQSRHRRATAARTTARRRRKLQLLIDGCPTNFALQNISEGGAMVDGPPNLEPGETFTSALRAASWCLRL